MPKILSSVGIGPYKSIFTFFQGFCIKVGFNGSGLLSLELLKQGIHDEIRFSVSLSMPGHRTFVHHDAFVFDIP